MEPAVRFGWLGVAGIEVRVNEQILAIDPFLRRPPFRRLWFGRVRPDSALVVTTIPQCDFVLVTHSHHDHLMDVPDVIQQTGATAFGSPNACHLLTILGVPEGRCHEIKVGDRFPLGLCWLLGTSVQKLAACTSPIFLFFHFPLVKGIELLGEWRTDLPVFRE